MNSMPVWCVIEMREGVRARITQGGGKPHCNAYQRIKCHTQLDSVCGIAFAVLSGLVIIWWE